MSRHFISFYIASKMKHAAKWRELYKNLPEGLHMESRWPFVEISVQENEDLNKRCAPHFWTDDIQDVRRSDFLVLFAEEGDDLNGALIETGAALASGIPVRIVGNCDKIRTWAYHPLISRYDTLEEALLWKKD